LRFLVVDYAHDLVRNPNFTERKEPPPVACIELVRASSVFEMLRERSANQCQRMLFLRELNIIPQLR